MVYRIEFHSKHYYKTFNNRTELECYLRHLKKYNQKDLKDIRDIRKVKKNGVSETVMEIFSL